jgi:GGDEF domain-containing protein
MKESWGGINQYKKERPKEGLEIPDAKNGEELLVEEIEEEIGFLKDKLDPEDYKKLLEQRVEEFKESNVIHADFKEEIEENREARKMLSKFRQVLKEKVLELRLAKIDTTTNLKIRSYFFSETIPKELAKILGPEIKDFDDEQWFKFLMDENKGLEKIELSAVEADVSYLNVANRDGHTSGDNLLEKIGELATQDRKTKKNAHRYGGDEFAYLFGDSGEAEFKMKTLQKSFSEAVSVSNLAKYGLKPNLDFGKASFSEALSVFRDLVKNKEGGERIRKDKVFKEFNTIWLMLADKRASINKAKTRIPLLMEKYQKGFDLEGKIINQEAAEHYDFLTGYLGKGAYEISKIKIAELIEESGNDEVKGDKLVWQYIQEIEQGKLSESQEYLALRDKVVALKVGIIDKM